MQAERKKRSGKERLLQKLQAKQGMAYLSDMGRTRDFSGRSGGKLSETEDWEVFFKSGNEASIVLSDRKPDIVEQINEKNRKDKDKERNRKKIVEENGGEWMYHGESGEWYWSGENEPITDNFENDTYSDGELEKVREYEKKEYEEMIAHKKADLAKSGQMVNENRKEALAVPLEPLPERELCAYERLRERNISEREKAMADSGFFEDLDSFKSEIGLVKDKNAVSSELTKISRKKKKVIRKQGKDLEKGFDNKTVGKEQLKSSDAGNSEDSVKPWYENFTIDEWHLHDCSG